MRLFNTLSRAREEFSTPDGVVRLYVCGITPYDTTHLGHARTYVVFDVLNRLLRHHGYQVRYIQNITDIDESILGRARQLGRDYLELGEECCRVFFEDMAALRVLPADHYPRPTQEIPMIQEVTRGLLEKGYGYIIPRGVYFRVKAVPDYGRLSRLGREEMLAIAAGQDDSDVDDPTKEDPLDFALWRRSGPGEPAWESPWGPGRPGWHIECTAMSLRYLGPRLDIHGGGADLIYPHHENEIAQSEAYTGERPFSRFWVHVGLVSLGGVKMSKSLGNMVFVRDLRRKFDPDAIRLYLISTHYRTGLDYREADLERAAARLERFRVAARQALVPANPGWAEEGGFRARFFAALDDDLDTPAALQVLDELAELGLAGNGRAAELLGELAAAIGLELRVGAEV